MAYKEIVTKAIIGKGRKKYKDSYKIEISEKPSTILGCWIINHNFSGKKDGNIVVINGSFDVNIWYSYDNDTKTNVINKKITYSNEEKVNISDNEVINEDIIVRSLKQPTCVSAKENGNEIDIEIEKELGIEVIGDTKVKVSSIDEDDNWDLIDEMDNVGNIETDYINKNEEQ